MWRVWARRGSVYRVLVGKPEGKRPLGRPRRRWVDNIRTDLQEVGCGYMDWIGLAQDRNRWRTLVSAVMNLRVPWNAGNFLTSCKPVSFSRRTLHHGVSKVITTANRIIRVIIMLQNACAKNLSLLDVFTVAFCRFIIAVVLTSYPAHFIRVTSWCQYDVCSWHYPCVL